MPDNLIVNGGFNEPWSYKRAWVCESGSPPRQMPTGNCFVQAPWEFWWEQGPDLHLPEVTDAWMEHDARRVVEGEKAIQFFKSFDQYHAGFWQVVELPDGSHVTIYLAARERWGFCHNNAYFDAVSLVLDGDRLLLKAHVQAWSNHNDKSKIPGYEECVHDPRCSWGVGKDNVLMAYQDAPPLNGEPWNDAISNVSFRIGVDLTAGTDPLAPTVNWSDWYISYNYHHELRFITEVDVEEPEHVDYEVTVHVPNQHAEGSYDRVHEIARPTFGSQIPSIDDAARVCDVICPSGKGGLAILYDFPTSDHKALLDYIEEQGPLTRVEFKDSQEAPSEWAKYLLWQCDPPWADRRYAVGTCFTICSQGCWLTDCAMALRIFNIDPDATPLTVDETLGVDGYARCQMLHSVMPKLGLRVDLSTTDAARARVHLESGGLVFIEVQPPSLMHFVLAVENAGEGDFLVLDPWKNKVALLSDLYAGPESFRLISKTEGNGPQPGRLEKLGLHMQSWEEGAPEFYSRTKSYATAPHAKVFSPDDAVNVLRRNPEAIIVTRHHIGNQDPYVNPPDGDYQAAANRMIDLQRDALYRTCDQIAREFPGKKEPYLIVESANEEYENTNEPKNQNIKSLDSAYARAIHETGYPMVAGIMLAAIGNPDVSQYHILVDLARETAGTGARWGYHAYFLRNVNYGGPDHLAEYLGMRWAYIDAELRKAGFRVPWYFGECGAIGGKSSPPEMQTMAYIQGEALAMRAKGKEVRIIPLNPHGTLPAESLPVLRSMRGSFVTRATEGWVAMYPNDGWRHLEVYEGSVEHKWRQHMDDCQRAQELFMDTPAGREGLVEGFDVFTTNAPFMGWKDFRVLAPQMELVNG